MGRLLRCAGLVEEACGGSTSKEDTKGWKAFNKDHPPQLATRCRKLFFREQGQKWVGWEDMGVKGCARACGWHYMEGVRN